MSFAWIVTAAGVRPATLDEACDANGSAPFLWVHLDGREEEDLAWLDGRSEIPEVARRALVALETRPRTEPMPAGALVNLRGLGKTPEDDPDALVSIRLWAQKGRVVSVCIRTPLALEPLCEAVKAGQVLDPGDLISRLATLITDELDPDVSDLGDLLDECEATLDEKSVYVMRRKVAAARSQAIGYRRFVSPQRQALERLNALEADWLDDDDRMHLREAADRCARMAEELEAIRERAALMHEQLTDLRAEQVDSRALMIAIVALIFLPLTFLTGLLGMNVKGIPYADQPWAFDGVVAVCVVIAAAISAYFAAVHWFRG